MRKNGKKRNSDTNDEFIRIQTFNKLKSNNKLRLANSDTKKRKLQSQLRQSKSFDNKHYTPESQKINAKYLKGSISESSSKHSFLQRESIEFIS